MDLLLRFLTLTLRENQIELQLSEANRNCLYMLHATRKTLTPQHRRFLLLA